MFCHMVSWLARDRFVVGLVVVAMYWCWFGLDDPSVKSKMFAGSVPKQKIGRSKQVCGSGGRQRQSKEEHPCRGCAGRRDERGPFSTEASRSAASAYRPAVGRPGPKSRSSAPAHRPRTERRGAGTCAAATAHRPKSARRAVGIADWRSICLAGAEALPKYRSG